MGLDGVELDIEIEGRFGISLPDSAVVDLQTVGDLHAFLMNRIRGQESGPCPSAVMFYPLRKLLVSEFGIQRCSIKPSSTLECLVEPADRPRFWQKLEKLLGNRLPQLEKSNRFAWKKDAFPESCATVGLLVEHCVNGSRITDEFGAEDSEPVWEVVCELVAEVAGVEKATLEPGTRFVEDLGF